MQTPEFASTIDEGRNMSDRMQYWIGGVISLVMALIYLALSTPDHESNAMDERQESSILRESEQPTDEHQDQVIDTVVTHRPTEVQDAPSTVLENPDLAKEFDGKLLGTSDEKSRVRVKSLNGGSSEGGGGVVHQEKQVNDETERLEAPQMPPIKE